jgi:hypothetical protein
MCHITLIGHHAGLLLKCFIGFVNQYIIRLLIEAGDMEMGYFSLSGLNLIVFV